MTSDRPRIALLVHDYNRHGGHTRYAAELSRRGAALYRETFALEHTLGRQRGSS
jgi:hypothetical protein